MPESVRKPYFAGEWYPEDAEGCRRAIAQYLQGSSVSAPGRRGLVGPHAGWFFSGPAAARGYAALAASRGDADLVVVFGSHRSSFGPSTVFRGDAWETPLGALTTARALADELVQLPGLEDEAVAPRHPDNGVELHLPFVRHFFPRAELLMAGVAASEIALDIGRRAGELARGRNAVFVGSTDLTHYGPSYDFAPEGRGEGAVAWVREVNDRGFIERVLANDAAGVLRHADEHASACCPGAVAATLGAVAAYGEVAQPLLVDYYLSFDIRPSASFVGYASIVL